MRKSTCLLPKVLFAVAFGLALLVCAPSAVVAQEDGVIPANYQSGSFFNRNLGTALRFNYHTQGYGTQEGVFSLGGMKVFNMEGATFFLDGQGTLSDDFGGGFNLGVGYRQLATLGNKTDSERIIGAGFWTDGQSSVNDNFFTQLGFSLESLGDLYDVRLNGSFPLDREKTGDATLTGASDAFFSGNNLFGAEETFGVDTALDVLDGEVAIRVADLEAWGFAGAYYLGGGEDDTGGYRLGVRGYAVPDVAVSFSVTEDDIYDTNFLFGITWFIGRTHRGNTPTGTLLDRFREPVLRNDFIAMTSRQETRVSGDALTLAGSTDLVSIVHVDSTAAAGGDGTFESPFDDISDVDDAGNSAANDIILVHGGSMFTGAEGQIVLQENQRLLGEGMDEMGNMIAHFVQTNAGSVALPETAVGAQDLLRPQIDGTGVAGTPMITLADGATVDNFTIDNAETGIFADGVTVPTGNTISNVLVSDATTGISLTNMMGTTVLDSNVIIERATGTALLIQDGSENVTMNGSINDTTGMSLVVSGRTGGTVQFNGTIDDDTNDDNSSTSMGVQIQGNADAVVSFDAASTLAIEVDGGAGVTGFDVQGNGSTTVSVTGTADIEARGDSRAVQFAGNTDSTTGLTFADLNASAINGNTVEVAGPGAVTMASVNTGSSNRGITNSGTGTAFANDGTGGSATMTINSNITNSGGGNVVAMTNRAEANDVFFNGDITDMSEGISVTNNSNGIMAFTGEVRLTNTGVNNSLTMTDNEGATVSFTDIQASTTDGNTLDVTGGGTLTISDANATNSIDSLGSGLAFRNVGNANGSAAVTIASTINNSAVTASGQSIDIRDRTENDIVINGNVSDDNEGINIQNNSGGLIAFAGETRLTMDGTDVPLTMLDNEGASVSFTDIQASSVDGNTLDVTGGGTLTISDANATNSFTNTGTGNVVDVTGSGAGAGVGDATVTIAGPITNSGGGLSVSVQDHLSNDITINGTVTDNDGGISLVDNLGTGTIDFQQAVVINQTNAASTSNLINLDSNTDKTIQFNGIMLDSDSTAAGAGTGFRAVGGGTLVVASPNTPGDNMIDMQNGTALDLNGMTIGAGGVAFDTVDVASGNGVGINLQTLDGAGQVAIGGGTNAGDGGTLVTTGTAISVNNANNVLATNMTVNNTGAAGGVLVTGQQAGSTATFTGLNVTTANADAVAVNTNTDGTIIFNDLTATTTGTGGAVVSNNNADATLSINDMTLTATGTGAGFSATGTGNLAVTGDTSIDTTTGKVLEVVGQNISANSAFDTVNASGTVAGTAVELRDLTGSTVTVGSGTNAGDGGTLTTTGADGAVVVDNADNVTIDNVSINNAATNGAGLIVRNNTTGARNFNNMVINTESQLAVNVNNNSGGTSTFADLTANTTASVAGQDAVAIQNNTGGTITVNTADVDADGAGRGVVVDSNGNATVNLNSQTINTETGTGLLVMGTGNTTTGGTGTITTTTGFGVDVLNAEDANLSGLTVVSGAADSVRVQHTDAATSDVTLNTLTITGATNNGVNIISDGTGEFDMAITNSNISTSGAGNEAVFYDLGANHQGRSDFTLTGSTLSADADNALQATLDQGTGDVRFLVQQNINISSDIAGEGAVDISVTSGLALNATIGNTVTSDAGDPVAVPDSVGDFNLFTNTNAGGDPFRMEVNDAGATINLDLRDNTASGGSVSYQLFQNAGTFNLVDRVDTLGGAGGPNNIGTVVEAAGVTTDIAPPVSAPTP
ncbi:MAG: hypothetical protein AAGD11_03525 [Planctomycetota bacterium]